MFKKMKGTFFLLALTALGVMAEGVAADEAKADPDGPQNPLTAFVQNRLGQVRSVLRSRHGRLVVAASLARPAETRTDWDATLIFGTRTQDIRSSTAVMGRRGSYEYPVLVHELPSPVEEKKERFLVLVNSVAGSGPMPVDEQARRQQAMRTSVWMYEVVLDGRASRVSRGVRLAVPDPWTGMKVAWAGVQADGSILGCGITARLRDRPADSETEQGIWAFSVVPEGELAQFKVQNRIGRIDAFAEDQFNFVHLGTSGHPNRSWEPIAARWTDDRKIAVLVNGHGDYRPSGFGLAEFPNPRPMGAGIVNLDDRDGVGVNSLMAEQGQVARVSAVSALPGGDWAALGIGSNQPGEASKQDGLTLYRVEPTGDAHALNRLKVNVLGGAKMVVEPGGDLTVAFSDNRGDWNPQVDLFRFSQKGALLTQTTQTVEVQPFPEGAEAGFLRKVELLGLQLVKNRDGLEVPTLSAAIFYGRPGSWEAHKPWAEALDEEIHSISP